MIAIPRFDTPWNMLVEEQVKDTFYYDHRWFELITKLYGYRIIPLTTKNAEGQITGFLPLCSISSPLTGRRLVSLPFSDHCPLFAADEESANDLIDQAARLAKEQHVKYLELRTGNNDVLAKRPDLTENNLYVNWTLPLADQPDNAWKSLRKPVQHQIKKSQKLGVQVRTAQKKIWRFTTSSICRRAYRSMVCRPSQRTTSSSYGTPLLKVAHYNSCWPSTREPP